MTQLDELHLSDPAAVKAIQEVGFLGYFLHPASPSDVARELGIPANRLHHHVRRYERLGLVQRVGHQGSKVLYQLTARTFHLPDLPESDAAQRAGVDKLIAAFWDAHQRSASLTSRDREQWSSSHFGDAEHPAPLPPRKDAQPAEPRPAHYIARTLRLSPARYRRLLHDLSKLIEDVASDEDDGPPCTVAALGFQGTTRPGRGDSLEISSFLGREEGS